MVILIIFAVIGIGAIFSVAYWAITTKCPKIGDKIVSVVEKIKGSFNKKDSETVEDLNKLDK
jgi:hypothetical protein